jgi:2-keto-4-pentenoate hydratase
MTSLAIQLWNARCTGSVVDPTTCELPKCKDEAHAVQREIVALSGHAIRGYKVGSTSLEAQLLLGTDEPGWGVLLAPYVHQSPAKITITPAHTPAVEGEFAFRMARDLPPRPEAYTRAEIDVAIAEVAGAVEVVGTRFSGGLAGKGRFLTTADCGVNIALVTTSWVTWESSDLRSHRVTMTVDGVARGTGTGSRALGDPMNVLLWLANEQSAAGRGLRAGDIVSTGTCTGLDAVRPGDVVQAEFGSLGTVDITFEYET